MSNSSSSFGKLQGTSIFVKTFPTSNNSSTTFIPFTPNISSNSIQCNYNTIFEKDVTVNGTFTNSSDAKLKTNVKIIYSTEADKLMETNPVTYQFKSDNLVENIDHHYGFIAQELEQLYPNLVEHNQDLNCKTINYLELIPLIICKMQKMQNQIDELLNSKN
jgi:hypothetical protein